MTRHETKELGYYQQDGSAYVVCTSLDQPHRLNKRSAQKLANDTQAVAFIREAKTRKVVATYQPDSAIDTMLRGNEGG